MQSVPDSPVCNTTPRFGTYLGRCGDTNLKLRERGVSRFRQYVSEKRWQWISAFDDALAVGVAIVDAGFFGMAFCWVFDRASSTLRFEDDVVLPPPLLSVTTHPTVGTVATVDVPRYRLRMERTREQLLVSGTFGGADISLAFEPDDDTAITAICPVSERDGGVNVTQKEPGVPVTGRVRLADGSHHTPDGVGFLDYSHGLLGRTTRWDWAFASGETADGTPVAFNLVSHFNDGLENVVWLDGEPYPVGRATIRQPERQDGHWHVSTDCGTVGATLTVEGARSQHVDAGLVKSSYHQPLGRFRGTVGAHEFEGVGVAEEHLTKW